MKLQKIVSHLQKLHPKEIDLSLDRIKILCEKLDNPQEKIKAISVVGTNGKQSTINAIFSILKEAKVKSNVYTSPHIQKINERFVFNNNMLNDDELIDLFEEVEKINDQNPLTFFEALSACYFYKAAQYPNNINLIEAGLFHRFDATNILKNNLASIVCSISKDHLDWLPEDQQTIEKIVFEKTSSLLNSNIIVSKQNSVKTTESIKKSISQNLSNKLFFNEDYSYSNGENGFFYYEDKFGGLKLPLPNILGQFQLENISTAIATIRQLNLEVKDDDIKNAITKIESIGRLQEIKSGKIKDLIKNNQLLLDGSHNEDGARVLNEYLQTLDCNKHFIIGMMSNKNHEEYISHFKDISSLTTVDIPNQQNAISGKKLKEKFQNVFNTKYEDNIEKAIKSLTLKENDILIITGSLYLAGEILNLN
ncbi:bifunctional folylpolyglutamate synthase/dihydrofolate synthase [Pelagibacterales bacterium SAG-MED38]|nr:bifunctional folylpolyglutamate synthase/dihydrofolate synthase [Pelagibacterales bacterium SAG-MED38]MBD1142249.1 bifunctional folylpolyglutamate synthase/dihydrofolate synthase [Pelagibacterales bacterium SAG-MED32]MBD1150738.1 bifunctional folylpolyglutamate synthase/dihydrofolate synthase [Pelagibacterales bacterium SAG-MED29]